MWRYVSPITLPSKNYGLINKIYFIFYLIIMHYISMGRDFWPTLYIETVGTESFKISLIFYGLYLETLL